MAALAAAAPMPAPALARLSDITLSYGPARGQGGPATPVLSGLDLTLSAGEFVALVGPSGVGKSTLLRLVAGLIAPGAGKVELAVAPGPARRATALVFQDARLMPWRRVAANVAFGLEGLALDRAARRDRAMAMLDLVGLGAQAGRWPHQLSGGQRQRVGLARALAVEPDLLLMDEPFGALDAMTRAGLQDELAGLWRRTGKTVLFVTHDIDEAVYLADRVLLLAGSPAGVRGEFAIGARQSDGSRNRADPALQAMAQAIGQALKTAS